MFGQLLVKMKVKISGAEIKCAYSTCTAGLIWDCYHEAGLLFCVEMTVLTEVAHPTCTSSMLLEWNGMFQKEKNKY